MKEYLEIVRTYYPECIPLNSKEVNVEGKGNLMSYGYHVLILFSYLYSVISCKN